MVTVAACQLALSDLDPDENVRKVANRLAGLPDGVSVALFPEYTLTGFVPDDRVYDVALSRDADHVRRVRDLAAEHDTSVLVGFVEQTDADGTDEYYNTVLYATPDGETTRYRKRHLWEGEREFLETGDDRVVVETPLGATGLLTCYDLNFVHESAAFAERRVDALFVVGAWPAAYAQNWTLLLRARALDGVRWVVGAGRTGRRELPGTRVTEYAGQSRAIRPDGSVHSALNRGERDLVADLDPDALSDHREFIPVLDC